jgi:hypothetical protein
MEALERERRELHAQKQHEIDVLKMQLQRATVSLKEEHETELLRERRLFEASKLQLTHQRDVLHRKLGPQFTSVCCSLLALLEQRASSDS